MNFRDKKQEEFIDIISTNFIGIHLISVRLGKTRIAIQSILKHSRNYINNPKILVLYPIVDIKKAWEEECIKLRINLDITYCTFISVDKVEDRNWDYIIVDEAHLLPPDNILPVVGELIRRHSNTILMSGTYNNKTLEDLKLYTGMNLIINYPTEMAIKDGIVADFQIIIHEFPLDNELKVTYGKVKKWQSTEQKECNRLSNKVQTTYGKEKMFHSLNRMRFINSCNSLVDNVNNWIKDNPDKRFLLFSADENVGKRYNLLMYNSKSKDDSVLQSFINQEINQLCLIRKGSTGTTFPNLDCVLITAINSNGENLEQYLGRSLLKDCEEKLSTIHIFVSTENFQQKWLEKSLEKINKDRIIYETLER